MTAGVCCTACLGWHEPEACPAPRERSSVLIEVSELHRLATRLGELDRLVDGGASGSEQLRVALQVADDADEIITSVRRALGVRLAPARDRAA